MSLHQRWYHYPEGLEAPADEARVENEELAEV
jgi:hypothetical protein